MPAHTTRLRARYAETDRAGVVYHSDYLHWFEVARTEMMREAGLPYRQLEDERGLLLTVVECGLRFKSPATYDDLVEIETVVGDLRKVRFRLDHRITRVEDGALLVEGFVVLACVRREGMSVGPLPPDLRDLLNMRVGSR